jgi:hypothetical protein
MIRAASPEGRLLLARVRPRSAKGPRDWSEVLVQQIRAARLPEPVREYRFDGPGGRRWRLDCAWVHALLAVEIQGSEFAQGRHNRGVGMAQDYEKYNAALLDGWAVILVTGGQVRNGYALDLLTQVLRGSGRCGW